MQKGGSRVALELMDLDRPRKVGIGRTARKPAPVLVPLSLTLQVTVCLRDAESRSIRINNLYRLLIIEWE